MSQNPAIPNTQASHTDEQLLGEDRYTYFQTML